MDFPEHIRGARAILGLTQPDVAEKSGLSLRAVRNAEDGIEVKQATKNILTIFYQAEGFEFSSEGINRSNISSYFLDSYLELLNDVQKTLPEGGEVLKHCVDERRSSPEVIEKVKGMRSSGIKDRMTISSDNSFIISSPEIYRKIPKEYFSISEVTLIYANKVAFFVEKRVLVIRSEYLSKIFRMQFEYWWKTGEEVNGA